MDINKLIEEFNKIEDIFYYVEKIGNQRISDYVEGKEIEFTTTINLENYIAVIPNENKEEITVAASINNISKLPDKDFYTLHMITLTKAFQFLTGFNNYEMKKIRDSLGLDNIKNIIKGKEIVKNGFLFKVFTNKGLIYYYAGKHEED